LEAFMALGENKSMSHLGIRVSEAITLQPTYVYIGSLPLHVVPPIPIYL